MKYDFIHLEYRKRERRTIGFFKETKRKKACEKVEEPSFGYLQHLCFGFFLKLPLCC